MKNITKINLLNIPISKITLKELMDCINSTIQKKEKIYSISLDAAGIVMMLENKDAYAAIKSADIISADGYYVVLASRVLGNPLPEQVFCVEIQRTCVELAYAKGYKIYFLGAEQDTLEKMIKFYSEKYSNSIIAGYRNGYFSADEEKDIVEIINKSGADILLVGISSPKRELFLNAYKNKLNVSFMSGVGGAFDIMGGKTKRAPKWIIKAKLEWLYRFILEPRRLWKRIFHSYPKFVYYVMKEKFSPKSYAKE